ncbi:MAG: hypothetical protein AB1479_05880 [Pseudomonadota bacterium]
MAKTAILVDGGFFIKRYRSIYTDNADQSPAQVVRNMYAGVLRLLRQANRNGQSHCRELYRVFYYDCPPLDKKLHNPVSGKPLDLSKTPEAIFRKALHDELRK